MSGGDRLRSSYDPTIVGADGSTVSVFVVRDGGTPIVVASLAMIQREAEAAVMARVAPWE